jgi:hypothetical protein
MNCDPPVSTAGVAGITGVYYLVQLYLPNSNFAFIFLLYLDLFSGLP